MFVLVSKHVSKQWGNCRGALISATGDTRVVKQSGISRHWGYGGGFLQRIFTSTVGKELKRTNYKSTTVAHVDVGK